VLASVSIFVAIESLTEIKSECWVLLFSEQDKTKNREMAMVKPFRKVAFKDVLNNR